MGAYITNFSTLSFKVVYIININQYFTAAALKLHAPNKKAYFTTYKDFEAEMRHLEQRQFFRSAYFKSALDPEAVALYLLASLPIPSENKPSGEMGHFLCSCREFRQIKTTYQMPSGLLSLMKATCLENICIVTYATYVWECEI